MSIQSTILFLLLFPLSTYAQVESLVNDKDIIWAAKVETVTCFDALNGSLPPQLLETVPVKTVQDNAEAPTQSPFTEKLKSMIAEGAFPAYADKSLLSPLSGREARSRLAINDTIVSFDPETYEEKIHILTRDLLETASFFVTQQLWRYNGRKNELETIALAIAPAIESPSRPGHYQPLAWFKLPPPQKGLFNLKSRAVQFASYVRHNISEEQIEVIKGEETHLKEILISRFKTGELTGYDQQRRPIPAADIEDIFIQQDTIITFDPETYEETVQVVRVEFGQLDITDFRVQQNWFFAPSRKTLQCSAQAVAPAIPIIDEYGTRLALRPLFFWRKE